MRSIDSKVPSPGFNYCLLAVRRRVFQQHRPLSDIQERQPPPESGHRRGPYGWSMAISQEAGAMSVTITDDGVGAVMFETFMGL
jgi:hypothetical protein